MYCSGNTVYFRGKKRILTGERVRRISFAPRGRSPAPRLPGRAFVPEDLGTKGRNLFADTRGGLASFQCRSRNLLYKNSTLKLHGNSPLLSLEEFAERQKVQARTVLEAATRQCGGRSSGQFRQLQHRPNATAAHFQATTSRYPKYRNWSSADRNTTTSAPRPRSLAGKFAAPNRGAGIVAAHDSQTVAIPERPTARDRLGRRPTYSRQSGRAQPRGSPQAGRDCPREWRRSMWESGQTIRPRLRLPRCWRKKQNRGLDYPAGLHLAKGRIGLRPVQ